MVRLPERNGEEPRDDVPGLAALSHEVKELMRLIAATDISELHMESGQARITIKRGAHQQPPIGYAVPSSVYTPPAVLPAPDTNNPITMIGHNPVHGEVIELEAGEELVVAPMVGTFYSAPAPNEPPYVQEGDTLEPGQTVCIIEAMKMMNPIEAEVGGVITRILVQNAEPVEYGQPLMVVRAGS